VRAGALLIASSALLAARAGAAADDEPICADRPGKANATCTAPAGHVQIESGLADWTLDRSGGDKETLLLLGATAIKYGLTERSHIEIDVTPFVRATSRAAGAHSSTSGVGDVQLRYKHQLTAADAAIQVSAYPFVKLPTAKHSLGNGRVEAGLAVPIAYSIPNSPWALTLGPELDWLADDDGGGHHLATAQAASLSLQATRRLNLSAEVWAGWNWDPAGTQRQASLDGAAAYLIKTDLQVDGGANFGLNRATPDVELFFGVAKRF
jgi:hypothetical protein